MIEGCEGQGSRGEHTRNMRSMVVTPEVFQLEMSALKFSKASKSSLMSETAETSQSAMGPYSAIAKAAFALNAWTATFREALVVKVEWWGGSAGGEGGEGGEGGMWGGHGGRCGCSLS